MGRERIDEVKSGKNSAAVRWRASSQHQLAQAGYRNQERRHRSKKGSRLLLPWILLCVLWLLSWSLLRRGPTATKKSTSIRGSHSTEVSRRTKPPKSQAEGVFFMMPSQRACPLTPPSYRRRFFSRPKHTAFSTAMLQAGWQQTSNWRHAEILWYQQKSKIEWKELHCWQAVNHLQNEGKMSHKGHFLDILREKNATKALHYLPESYALWRNEDLLAFRRAVLSDQEKNISHSKHPDWILKKPAVDGGKGVEVIEDPSTLFDAKHSLQKAHRSKVIQRYVKNLLLLDGHKFDLRVYWTVVTTEPHPLVLYYGGTLRVSLDEFNATNASKGQHLTNAAQQAGGHDKNKSSELSRQPMSTLWRLIENSPRRYTAWPRHVAQNPRAYLECQIRLAITSMWQAFASTILQSQSSQGAKVFSLLGCDIMLDHDLNLFISELQSGPGLPTNTIAVREIMHSMLPDLARLTRRLHSSESQSHRLNSSDIHLQLPLGGFEVLVNGSKAFPQPWCDPSLTRPAVSSAFEFFV